MLAVSSPTPAKPARPVPGRWRGGYGARAARLRDWRAGPGGPFPGPGRQAWTSGAAGRSGATSSRLAILAGLRWRGGYGAGPVGRFEIAGGRGRVAWRWPSSIGRGSGECRRWRGRSRPAPGDPLPGPPVSAPTLAKPGRRGPDGRAGPSWTLAPRFRARRGRRATSGERSRPATGARPGGPAWPSLARIRATSGAGAGGLAILYRPRVRGDCRRARAGSLVRAVFETGGEVRGAIWPRWRVRAIVQYGIGGARSELPALAILGERSRLAGRAVRGGARFILYRPGRGAGRAERSPIRAGHPLPRRAGPSSRLPARRGETGNRLILAGFGRGGPGVRPPVSSPTLAKAGRPVSSGRAAGYIGGRSGAGAVRDWQSFPAKLGLHSTRPPAGCWRRRRRARMGKTRPARAPETARGRARLAAGYIGGRHRTRPTSGPGRASGRQRCRGECRSTTAAWASTRFNEAPATLPGG